MQKFTRSLLAVGAVLGLAACGDDVSVTETPPPTPTVTGVSVSPASTTIKVGETVVFSASVSTTGTGVNTAVAWSSANAAIASVNATTGAVTGVAAGTTTIRATSAADAAISGAAAVTVVQPGVQSVSLAPGQLNLVVGNTGQVTATVARDAGVAGTVTWSTGNAAVATVTGAGNTVTITAVAVGTTTITATSTADASKAAAIGVTVAPAPLPPTVSIASIDQLGLPANLAGVAGQVDVTLNIFSGTGNVQLSHAVVMVGNKEMARQTFTNGAPSASIQLSVNTANYNPTTFVPDILNGPNTFKAQVFAVGNPATPAAENTIQVVIANADIAFIGGTVTPTNPAGVVGAGPATWYKGDFKYKANVVAYSGANLASVSYNLAGTCAAPASGAAPSYEATFVCTGDTGLQTIAAGVTFNYTTTPGFVPNVAYANPALPAPTYPSIRIDNVAPTYTVGNVAFNDSFDQMWINASYGISQDFAVADVNGVGVDAAQTKYRLWVQGAPGSCTGTQFTTGNDLAETVASDGTPDGYQACVTGADLLGNSSASGATNWFGVDKVAPAVRAAGSTAATPSIAPSTVAASYVSSVANTSIYSMASPFDATRAWGLEGQDTRAGFNQNAVAGFPAVQTMKNHAGSSYACGFTNPMPTVLSDNYVRVAVLATFDCATAAPGYYWYEGWVVDRAGNASTKIQRNYAIDQYAAPVLSALLPGAVTYTAGQPAVFNIYGTDDLEIIEADLTVTYPGFAPTLTYPLNALSNGVRWDATLNTPVTSSAITINSWLARLDMTCSGAAAPYASCAAVDALPATLTQFNNVGGGTNDEKNPTGVSAVAYDVGSNASAPIAQALSTLITNDVAHQWPVSADILTWRVSSTTAPTIQAEHKASTSISQPYFDSVVLVKNAGGTNAIICGTFTAPVLTDNGLNRFWTYSISKPTSGPCNVAGNWHAVGIKNNAGLVTNGVP